MDVTGEAGRPAPQAEAPDQGEAAFVPDTGSRQRLFGPARFDGVRERRSAAASQIARTLRVWRKASGEPAQEDDGASEAAPEEETAKEGTAEAEGGAGPEEQAPQGVARKIFLARPPSLDRQLPDPARVDASSRQWNQH